MLNTPFSPWPSFSSDEVKAVADVLASNKVNYWTGQECREFEREFAAWSNTHHAIALANGTLALDLALYGLGIGARNGGLETDEVIVTPRTFIASISCVINAGAKPVFADVDANSGNISAETIVPLITSRTKAVLLVHLAGWPCDMDPIMALSEKHGYKVIEDCAQAHGAYYKSKSVGSIGHVGAWSFCQDKIMTTGGEGGMVTCNDKSLWARMWAYKDHGKSFEAVYERQHPTGFKWLHESFGTNWRMLEMQAVIGRYQLKKMSQWSSLRRRNAEALTKAFAPHAGPSGPIRIPEFVCATCDGSCVRSARCIHAYYKLYFYVRPETLAPGWTRDRIIAEISSRGVPAYQGSCSEVYLERAFEGTESRPKSPLLNARWLGETSLMLLVHPSLTAAEIEKTGQVVSEVLVLSQK